MRHSDTRKGAMMSKGEAAAVKFLIHEWSITDGYTFFIADIPAEYRPAVRRLMQRAVMYRGSIDGTAVFTFKCRKLYEEHIAHEGAKQNG